MESREFLAKDAYSHRIQALTLNTQDIAGDSTLLNQELTGDATEALTIEVAGLYLITGTTPYHIEVCQAPGEDFALATTDSLYRPAYRDFVVYLSQGAMLSVIKADGEINGTLYIA